MTLPPTPTPSNPTPPPEISCAYLHTPSLALNPSFESEGEAFTLPGLTHTLPEFSDPDSTREFSLHAYSFVREFEPTKRSRPDDGDANPRARKKAHLEVDAYSMSRNIQAEPATTLLFVYNVSWLFCFSELADISIVDGRTCERGWPFPLSAWRHFCRDQISRPVIVSKVPRPSIFCKPIQTLCSMFQLQNHDFLTDIFSATMQCLVAKQPSSPGLSGALRHGRTSQRLTWIACWTSKSCSLASLSEQGGPSHSLRPPTAG